MSHTQESWASATQGTWKFHEQGDANDYAMITQDGRWVIAFRQNGEIMPEVQKSNARRIVACVNACEGIASEYLEHFGAATFKDFKHVKEQRDTAWQELREIREAIHANPEESTADEVRRVAAHRDKILNALQRALDEIDELDANNTVATMLRKTRATIMIPSHTDPITEYYTDRNNSGNAALST